MMKYIYAILLVMATCHPVKASNEDSKNCLKLHGYEQQNFDTFSWNKVAACAAEKRSIKRAEKLAELREHLRKHPYYRYPGRALPNNVVAPLHKCWGKNRKYHREGHC